MRKFAAISLAAPVLVSACAVGPAYEAPTTKTGPSPAFVTRSNLFEPADPVPEEWWRLYHDPTIDALVSRALIANTDLRVASANLEEARAVLNQARAARLPSTGLSGGVSYGDGAQASPNQSGAGGDAQWSESASLTMAWEVDLFGRVRHAIQAAQADTEAVEAARDAVRVTVAAETTRAYLNACAYGLSLEIAHASFDTGEQNLRLVREKQRVGTAGRLDVARAGAAAATARAAIPMIEAQRDFALFELAALLGETPSGVPDAARTCASPPEPDAVLPVGDGLELLRRRPDLRQAERRLAANTARIGVATAELYPTISLGGSGAFFRNDSVTGDDSFSFSAGPMVSWSFPNVSSARARLRQAEARGKAALATFDGRVVTALKEVEQSLTAVSREDERLSALREAQERSESAYNLAELSYRAGSLSYLEVLVAQSDLLAARAAYADSIQRLSSARVDLFKALGGGWQSAVTDAP